MKIIAAYPFELAGGKTAKPDSVYEVGSDEGMNLITSGRARLAPTPEPLPPSNGEAEQNTNLTKKEK